MGWYQSPYTLLMVVTSLVSVSLAVYAWGRQRVPEARPLALLLLGSAEWTVFYGLELASGDLQTKLLLAKLQFFGIVAAPGLFLVFALQYTGRGSWLTRRNLLLLVPEPIVVLLLTFTNEGHRLIYSQNTLDTGGPWPLLISSWGPIGWINIAYSYALMAAVVAMIVQLLLKVGHRRRWQATALLFTVLVPWGANAIYISGHNPFRGLDLTPVGFVVMAVALASGISGLRLGDMLSVSRRAIIEQMRDGIVVMDSAQQIIDLNPTALRLAQLPKAKVIGRLASDVWPEWPVFDALPGGEQDLAAKEMVLTRGEPSVFDVQISPVTDWRDLVVSWVATTRDVTERKKREEELARQYELTRSLADRDPLTGLLNHRAIHQRLEREVALASRANRPVSLVMMDLDGFKQVNDTHGHPVGDQVLRHVASLLAGSSRVSDIVGRYGGDEFVAVLPDTPIEGAVELANRWRTTLAQHPYLTESGSSINLKMSLGASTFPTHAENQIALIETADSRMYESKRRGGDTVVCATPSSRVETAQDRSEA